MTCVGELEITLSSRVDWQAETVTLLANGEPVSTVTFAELYQEEDEAADRM